MYGPITALQTLDYDWCKSIGLLVHFFAPDTHCALVVALSEKSKVPFSMAIGNGELMHECFPKHLRTETARTK